MSEYRLPVQFSFAWAAWRVVRANERKEELRALALRTANDFTHWPQVFVDSISEDGTYSQRVDFRDFSAELSGISEAFQYQATLLLGEAIYSLRAALDYCVFLAILDRTGKESSNAQFPIWSQVSQWSANDRKIKGLSEVQLGWIRACQPFSGVEWSQWLVRLSNGDKHRSPVVLEAVAQYCVGPLPSDVKVGARVPTTGHSFALPVAERLLSDGTSESVDAVQVLNGILVGVAGVVNRFLVEAGYDAIEVTEV